MPLPRLSTVLGLSLTLAVAACGGGGAARDGKAPSHPALREMHGVVAPKGTSPAEDTDHVKVLPASASKITFARMAKHPEPGWNVPRGVHHAPDGKTITYLASESGDETMSLMAFDASTGKTSVLLRAKDLVTGEQKRSREEELRRERQRDRNEGITQHDWAKKAQVLLVPHAGDIFVRDYAHDPAGSPKRLTKTPEPEIDPALCATGERVAFVRGTELFAIDVATGKETALTSPVKDPKTNAVIEGITHGLSDFVAQEELGESSGFFWSPKCDRIAYLEVDERHVDKIPVLGYRAQVEQGASSYGADLMMQRYPRAGTKNPIVRAGIVDLATKKTTWLKIEGDAERYHGHFMWSDDGRALFLQTLTRGQKKLSLHRVDPASGKATEIASETSAAWVEFSPMRFAGPEHFLFTSTKSGHRHLELRSQKDGALVRALTTGTWDVTAVAYDEHKKRALITGTRESPIERHLYAVDPDSGAVTKLTSEHGVHSVRVNETGSTWIDVHSATDRMPRAVIVREGQPAGELPVLVDPDLNDLALRPTEHFTLQTPDGDTLHGARLLPRKITGKHPAIVMVYGGPEAQLVFDVWSPRLMWQHLADRGFVVIQIDNRGSGGQGPAFAQKVHKQLGRLELDDQLAAARYLAKLPFVDPSRIGIYGHSYGGFMAALAMLDPRTNSVFKAGVAGSPVTDWRLYDTGYTERYMETPQSNAAGYEASDLAKKASGLQGKLLITHAMMDENVHYAHTAKLVDALIAANKHFDLLVLPGERHGLRAPSARTYMPERIAAFFADNL